MPPVSSDSFVQQPLVVIAQPNNRPILPKIRPSTPRLLPRGKPRFRRTSRSATMPICLFTAEEPERMAEHRAADDGLGRSECSRCRLGNHCHLFDRCPSRCGRDGRRLQTTQRTRCGWTVFHIYGTLSPTYRSGTGDVQNRGFFPEVWLGVAFQPKKFVSARATACLSCHNSGDVEGRIDLVEAAVRFDFMQLVEPRCRGNWQATVDAGRFVVPFGAFSSQVNPGVFRTMSKPLIFNMGLRVLDRQLGDPVLTMPYSDEGANLNFGVPITESIRATWNDYVVNGLQGGANGINFDASTNLHGQQSQSGDWITGHRRQSVHETRRFDHGRTLRKFSERSAGRF